MRNKRLWLLIGAGLVASALVVVASFFRPQEAVDQPSNIGLDQSTIDSPTLPEGSTPEPDEEPVEEQDFGGFYIKNFSVLTSTFNVSDSLFINSTVQKFAVARNFSVSGLELDQASFKQTTETKWGFITRDANGNQIFYITITRLPEGNIKVEESLR